MSEDKKIEKTMIDNPKVSEKELLSQQNDKATTKNDLDTSKNKAKETANPVVSRYKPIVLVAIEPSFTMFEREDIPETNEKNTKGTTINKRRFLNTCPPRLKMYFSTARNTSTGICAWR